MVNSVTKGRMDIYLKERMQAALDNNESVVNTGVIEYANEFKGIFDDSPDYPISKLDSASQSTSLTFL